MVTITLDDGDPADVVARLHLERRTDPARRAFGAPPVIAEEHGRERGTVLAALRALADSDAELDERVEQWVAARPRTDAAGQRHVRMPDGHWWRVVRRVEPPHPAHGAERRTFLFFYGDGGTIRRAEVGADSPNPGYSADQLLRDAWAGAEVLQ